MKVTETSLRGCFQITPNILLDDRGTFVKTFHKDIYADYNLPTTWGEEYYSKSRRGVLRGMHFQTPPYDHDKVIYCMQGRVLDVVVDLRKNSITFGRHVALELDGVNGNGLLIPRGMAHGFLALTDDVIMSYKVTTTYVPNNDSGIRFDSFGFDWGGADLIISARDLSFVSLADFNSPF